ncbi:hypothetical protein BP00DRAFT_425489 [Aspergillus indologenus CBS 114.80]|uniref:Uncharacterized protein n=1 Tax=Aspergillus indologenus CBS 114.80 TaxID=1450541 RepID=A0A2V5I6A8_9EURO|nr:hypothetical protein BP00DRAFT_425489 [Aspergillus indologenus CBS 114.80]
MVMCDVLLYLLCLFCCVALLLAFRVDILGFALWYNTCVSWWTLACLQPLFSRSRAVTCVLTFMQYTELWA